MKNLALITIILVGIARASSSLEEGIKKKKPSEGAGNVASLGDRIIWEQYKAKHGKKYDDVQIDQERMLYFLKNLELMRKHNELYDKGEVTFRLEMNYLADMPYEEYKKRNGFRAKLKKTHRLSSRQPWPQLNGKLPEAVDWRKEGYVTEVKDQGKCGSCWAFSATGSLEGQNKRKSGKLVSLSEQNLIDCSFLYLNDGCQGGLAVNAFAYIMDNGGIDTEESYPYEGLDGDCRFKNDSIGATDTSYVDLPEGNETALMLAVATIGPISVAIDASSTRFSMYSKGIFYDGQCGSGLNDLDHGVLIVGYGGKGFHKYWIVKNSWGTSWGDDGYILMARDRNNNCGIATSASYPIV